MFTLLRRRAAKAAGLPVGSQVRLIPALRAPRPAPARTYTIAAATRPLSFPARCLTHGAACHGPWYALEDGQQRLVDVYCISELEAA
ncbi:hypothetical protein G3I32_36220 [Streptomyces coelicoflavus]|uniref:Uncharacterized protein n=1 Tax=Streptomyces coelicoflavus TaxID=285562 RepID=A0A7K3PW92_9ACTN|nr:hypothetical protein [Streptomyces coelicoflavus]NEB14213.1 hypothetical protein [Streptomyces coelicoflavus]